MSTIKLIQDVHYMHLYNIYSSVLLAEVPTVAGVGVNMLMPQVLSSSNQSCMSHSTGCPAEAQPELLL